MYLVNTFDMNNYNKISHVRICFLFILLCCLFLFTALRVISVSTLKYSPNEKVIKVCDTRGLILDRNMLSLSNELKETYAAAIPSDAAITALNSYAVSDEKQDAISKLKKGEPVVCKVIKPFECAGVKIFSAYSSFKTKDLSHLLGYIDAKGVGISGLNLAYNDLLSREKSVTAHFAIDGKGRTLLGIDPEIKGNNPSCAVITTIDIDIQKRVKELCSDIKDGTVIVCDSKSGEILSLLSAPNFDPDNVSLSLDDENSPLVNKSLMAYSVGSVFKPCVAAAAIENGLSDFTFDCEGFCEIEGRKFNCHKREGHGMQDLSLALANSCNCYFYNLAQNLGYEKIYKKAKEFNLGVGFDIADNYSVSKGNIPSPKSVLTKSETANLGIGQGGISLSPLSVLNIYNAIANGGEYYVPSVVSKTVKDGKATKYKKGGKVKVLSENTADMLKNMLKLVVTNGTGIAAQSNAAQTAGKTATAQTGRYNGNKEINDNWFCGFFPFDDPQYTVLCMQEGECTVSSAEIFSRIATALSK